MAMFPYQLDKIVIGLSSQLVCAVNEKQEAWRKVQLLQVHNSTILKAKDNLSKELDTIYHNLSSQKSQMRQIKIENQKMRQTIRAVASMAAVFKKRLESE